MDASPPAKQRQSASACAQGACRFLAGHYHSPEPGIHQAAGLFIHRLCWQSCSKNTSKLIAMRSWEKLKRLLNIENEKKQYI
jgi:hypothetical protein